MTREQEPQTEANAELGQCTQAVLDQTINLLRDRVDMPHLTTTRLPTQLPSIMVILYLP